MFNETDERVQVAQEGGIVHDEDWLKGLNDVPTCQGDFCLPTVTIGGTERDGGSGRASTAAAEKLLPPPPPEDDEAIDFYDLYGDGEGHSAQSAANKTEDSSKGDAASREKGTGATDSGTEDKMQWIDGGQFTADDQGRVRKTVSEDGTKVREFNYTGSDPNQITEITIDGNRFYKRNENSNEWQYFVDGQFRGIWRGDVDMQKNGLYAYTATCDKVTHEFGSARQELRNYKRGDDQPAPLPQPDGNRGERRGNDEGAHGEDDQARRERDDQRSSDEREQSQSDGDQRRPDGERPAAEVKEKYGTADAAEAVRAAQEAGLPLIVHIGANYCGPCKRWKETFGQQLKASSRNRRYFCT